MFKLWLGILWSFSKIGVLGFGGGPAFIPLIQEEVVDVNGWLTTEEFVDTLAIGNTLPGPIATKMAAYTGWKIAGVPGASLAVLGTVGPSMILMILLITFANNLQDNPRMQGVLKAIRPAVVALLAWTVWDIAPKAIKETSQGVLAVATFAVIIMFNVHPGLAIVGAAVIGFLFF
jgi:chromate transporter